jgi:hypothetical protein
MELTYRFPIPVVIRIHPHLTELVDVHTGEVVTVRPEVIKVTLPDGSTVNLTDLLPKT